LGRCAGLDVNAFLAHYPLRLPWPKADVYHLTAHTFAGALLFGPPPGPVVVTVHDVVPYLVRHDRKLRAYRHPLHRLFDRLALRGLQRADALLADSHWTQRTLVDVLGIAAHRITVVPLGVEHERYRPLDVPARFRKRYRLPEGPRYVLYVGSEDPRKNLAALWRAFALVCGRRRDVRLIKVGAPHHPGERRRLQALAHALGIGEALRWIDSVPEADLPLFYNAAGVVVLPSLYEGFGLPVLEALACGARVVCSNTTALPEVAGSDAMLCAPVPGDLARAIECCLAGEHAGPAQQDREERQRWARRFTWTQTAAAVDDVYRLLGARLRQ
jgi:glycosyltransferase involved in cell wall biosynthesis